MQLSFAAVLLWLSRLDGKLCDAGKFYTNEDSDQSLLGGCLDSFLKLPAVVVFCCRTNWSSSLDSLCLKFALGSFGRRSAWCGESTSQKQVSLCWFYTCCRWLIPRRYDAGFVNVCFNVATRNPRSMYHFRLALAKWQN